MNQKIPIMFAGAFGGSFANILGVAIALTKGEPLPQPSYLLAVVLFALLGAGVAAVFEETVLKKAFLLGIGLPSLLQLSIGNATAETGTARRVGAPSAYYWLVSPVYAQGALAEVPGRTLELSGVSERTPTELIFLSGQKEVERRPWVSTMQGSKIPVPGAATHFRVEVAGDRSATEQLSTLANESSSMAVEVKESDWSGLLKGLGVRDIKDKSVLIQQIRK